MSKHQAREVAVALADPSVPLTSAKVNGRDRQLQLKR